jgi:hypothetical protein
MVAPTIRKAPIPARRTFRSRPGLTPPTVVVTTPAKDVAPGFVFVGPTMPLILDNAGEPVWFGSGLNGVACFCVQTYQDRPVLTWWEGSVVAGHGEGEDVIADETYTEIKRVSAGNGFQGDLHEFLLTPHGSALITGYAAIPFDLSSIGGPTNGHVLDSIVQEVDVASGHVVFEWHSTDHVSLDETYTPVGAGGTAAAPFDYFHINSIDVDTDGNLIVSARATWAAYKIDRRTGAVIWRLGGKQSDFAMGAGSQFEWQHDIRRQAHGTITLFDDAASPKEEPQSRGLVLAVNESLKSVKLLRQYTHPTKLLVPFEGNLQVLPNGKAFMGFGGLPYFSEFAQDGRLAFDAHFASSAFSSYRAFRQPWVGRPLDRPAVATEVVGADVNVYASWNGATEVSRWQVLAGPAAGTLAPAGSAARSGFETTVRLNGAPASVAVEALDASGNVLGTSSLIAV